MGKAFDANGGYLVDTHILIKYLREKSPFYIYSSPITPSEAAIAIKTIEILDSNERMNFFRKIITLTKRFGNGFKKLSYDIIESDHTIVPVMIQDTEMTKELVDLLFKNGILVTESNHPAIPKKGDGEVRFQISCDHTENDIDYVLEVLKCYREESF